MKPNSSVRRPAAGLPWALILSLQAAVAAGQPPLQPPPQPAGNPTTTAKVNLGKALFWDEQLSSTRTMACGSCHRPALGGSDPRSIPGSARATHPGPDGLRGTPDDIVGSPGVVLNNPDGAFAWSPVFGLLEQVTSRLAPSHINAAYAPLLFWDGRAGQVFLDPVSGSTVLAGGGALENQAAAPPVSSAEMGHVGRDWIDVAARVAASRPLMLSAHVPTELGAWIAGRSYPELFSEAFGDANVSGARVAMAIASYERTQFSNQTPFDERNGGNPNALTADETAGFQLFGQLGCATCHAGALMSDNQFHYIGVRPAAEDPGRFGVTGLPQDMGAFRTPSLRNVELRPAFMHDGSFSTLEEVVDFYDRGGDFDAPNKAAGIQPLNLTAQQRAQLLAFLKRPLTDPRVAAETAPFDRPELYTEGALVPTILAGGVSGSGGTPPRPIALEPPLAGNSRFTVGVDGALGGAEAVLVVDAAEPQESGGIPATGSFARITTTLQGSGPAAGFGSATLPIADDRALYGTTLYGRWYVNDPAAAGGVASSPSFRMTIFGPGGAIAPVAVAPDHGRGGRLRLDPVRNPFVEGARLRFELGEAAGHARMSVYDAGGRLVRRLFDRGSAPAGVYSVEWDGRDSAGRSVRGGVYFVRLETPRDAVTARIVRIS